MTSLCRAVLVFLPLALAAQMVRDREIPLKPWPAALYWQPTQAEARLTANAAAQANTLAFVAMTPCRVVDTRTGSGFSGAFGAPSLAGGTSRTFPIQTSSACPIPSSAQAYSFNVTVVPPGFLGFVTLYPTGQPRPNASTLNSFQGYVVANAAIVPSGPVDSGGGVDVYASNPTDIIIDINGYYVSSIISPAGGTNTSLGTSALAANTTGTANSAIGSSALAANTTGSTNTAIGSSALAANTTGYENTAVGSTALARQHKRVLQCRTRPGCSFFQYNRRRECRSRVESDVLQHRQYQ